MLNDAYRIDVASIDENHNGVGLDMNGEPRTPTRRMHAPLVAWLNRVVAPLVIEAEVPARANAQSKILIGAVSDR